MKDYDQYDQFSTEKIQKLRAMLFEIIESRTTRTCACGSTDNYLKDCDGALYTMCYKCGEGDYDYKEEIAIGAKCLKN